MASSVTLKTIYKAYDKFSAPLKKMAAASTRFGKKTQVAMAKAERATRRLLKPMNRITKKLGGIGAIAGGLSIAMAFGAGSRAIVDLDKNLGAAAAKFGIYDRGSEAFLKLKETAQEVGATTEFTAGQAAEGLNFLAMAGFNAEQSIAALPGVIDLATAAQVELGTASDIASDSLGAFNLMTSDSVQLGKNLARVNDVMAKTTSSANTTMEAMFETIKDGAPVATAAGASIETFSALTGVLANAGIKGSKAGTTLKNMFIKLQAPSAAGAKMLKKMGIQTADANGNMRDIIDILGDLDKATAKMGGIEKAQIMDELFGARAIAGANVLLAEGADKIKAYRKELEDSTGVSKKMAGFMRSGLSGAIAAMKSAFEAVAITVGDTFQPEIDRMIEGLTNVARNSGKWLKENKALIKTIFKVAKWLLIFFAVLKVASIAMAAFNAIVALNPIGIIILAVMALIIAIIALVKHWDIVKEKLRQFADSSVFQILKLINPIFMIIDAIRFFKARWDGIRRVFKEQGILAGIKAIGKAILSFMLKPIEAMLKLLAKIPMLKDRISPALEKMSAFRAGLDEGLVAPGDAETAKPVNLAATKSEVETRKFEEIKQSNKLDIELRNKTDKEAEVMSNPSAIPITSSTW